MLTRVFTQIISMSLKGSLVILAVMLVRLMLKRAPKIYSYLLWAVVLFRLLCPISIPAPVSVVPEIPVLSEVQIPAQAGTVQLELNGDWKVTYVESEPVYRPELQATPSETPVQVTPDIWGVCLLMARYVWLSGVAMMALYSLLVYLRLRLRLRNAIPVRSNIYLSGKIPSPFVLGLIRPKIYLPTFLAQEERGYIIAHEQHHIFRLDPAWKLMGFAALTLHWFNPLVWIAYVFFCKDMEMSCDEAVIRKLGTEVRADYAASLLNLATGRKAVSVMPLAFGEGDTKERVKNMSKWKKPKLWICILAAVLILTAAVILVTDPMASQEPSDDPQLNPIEISSDMEGAVDIIQSWAGWTGEGPVWSCLNASKLQYSSVQHLPIHKFDTRRELESFMDNAGAYLTMDDASKGVPSFTGTASRYDEAFFDTYTLIVVYIPSGNSGRTFRVSGMNHNYHTETFTVHIEETANSQIKENKQSGWFMSVAVPDVELDGLTEFDADLTARSEDEAELTYIRPGPEGAFYHVEVPLRVTDLSGLSETAKKAVEQEWATYDRLPEFDRLVSSRLWGCVYLYADSWQEAVSQLNLNIKNPLESVSYLKKGNYMDGTDIAQDKQRVQTTLMALSSTNREISQVSMRTGYTMEDIRITFYATVWNQGGIYQTGGGHSEQATFRQDAAVTATGKSALLVQSDKEEKYCSLDSYWVDGNVLYHIYLVGKPDQQEKLQKVMAQLLSEV